MAYYELKHRNLNGIKNDQSMVFYKIYCFIVATKYRMRAMIRAGDEKFPLRHLKKNLSILGVCEKMILL